MKKISLRFLGAAFFCFMLLCGATVAQAKSISPLTNQLVILEVSSKSTTITVTSAIAESDSLPANITLLAPKFCKIISFKSFDSQSSKDFSKLSYTKKADKKTKSQVEQVAYNATLTKQRGVRATYTCDAIVNNESSSHTIFGMGWTTKTDADTLTMGAVAPNGSVGIGKGINLLGTDSSGNKIYGKTFKNVKANKEYILQMGFMKKSASSAEKTQVQKKSFFESKNALLIIVLGAFLLVAVVILIIILIKARAQKNVDDFDYDDDENEEEEE